jgi:hypothetical protein
VYGLAIYCPACGQLAPAQQFAELVRVQRDRLAVLDGLDAPTRRDLMEAGVVSATYESTFKDGFGALETYLKGRFQQEAKKPHEATGHDHLPAAAGHQRTLQAAPGRRPGGGRWTAGVGGAAAGCRHPPCVDPQRRSDRRQVPHPGDQVAAGSGGSASRCNGPTQTGSLTSLNSSPPPCSDPTSAPSVTDGAVRSRQRWPAAASVPGLDLLPTWVQEQEVTADRQLIAVMPSGWPPMRR